MLLVIPVLCCGSLVMGCSGGTPSSQRSIPASAYGMKSPAAYSEWDVKFIKGAYLSHSEVTEVLRKTPERTDNPKIRELATGILTVRNGELQMLTTWLKSWDMPAPKPSPTSRAVKELNRLSDTAYDSELLEFLVKNQQALLRLATQEQEAGKFTPARRLAEQTVKSSTGVISNMRIMSDNLKQ
ncbi:DUF305 domain-containing protein [Actinomadura livida]|nr:MULTISPECIES: DUF305 domain-containing protein [Actinomadura]MBB4774469.1 uncharacterized protein (DUF305 family) [Actinomadura catellatispora]